MKPQKYPSSSLAWIAILLYFLLTLSTLPLFFLKNWVPLNWIMLIAVTLINVGTFFGMKSLYLKRNEKWIFKNRNQNQISYPLLIVVGLALVLSVIIPIINLLPVPFSVFNFYEKTLWSTGFPNFILILFIIPIFDELIFRGIIQERLRQRFSPVWAIVIASFFYGLIHLNPWYFILNFFLGLFLGWVYYRSRSIKPGLVVHMVINAELYLFNTFFGSEKGLTLFTNGLFNELKFRILVPIFTFILMILMLLWLHRIYNDDELIDWDLYR
jgi:uncharacterized protein